MDRPGIRKPFQGPDAYGYNAARSYWYSNPKVRRPPSRPKDRLQGWSFTCFMCTPLIVTDHHRAHPTEEGAPWSMRVPQRCELCSKDKYSWTTRKDLLKSLPKQAVGYKASLHTYTLGSAEVVTDEHIADTRYYELHEEMKTAFRKFIRSKWWRNRVDGCFYTVEVKQTTQEDGYIKLHPHVHAIVLHRGKHDFKEAAMARGLGDYVYVRRIRGRLEKPINYILKYALKGYGDSANRDRDWETLSRVHAGVI